MNTLKQNYPNGTIFFRMITGKMEYWKITGMVSRRYPGTMSYNVIKCSKTGKEFRTTNSFVALFIDRELENPDNTDIGLVGQSEVGTKASCDGELMGKTKRRITHIENTIKSYTIELIVLKKEMFQLNLEQGTI